MPPGKNGMGRPRMRFLKIFLNLPDQQSKFICIAHKQLKMLALDAP